MAKRRDEDEEEQIQPERKRRFNWNKPAAENSEDDASGPPSKKKDAGRGTGKEDDEGDLELSISTGNVILDIILDFRDDCYYWSKEHFLPALLIGIVLLLFCFALTFLSIRYIVKYIYRPTIQTVVSSYDYGSYGEAKMYAEELLPYIKSDDYLTRSTAYFILGASTLSITELNPSASRSPFYLAAANYLAEAEKIGFPPQQRTEGYFLYGKALYLAGELTRCREPLLRALEYSKERDDEHKNNEHNDNEHKDGEQRNSTAKNNVSNTKLIYWYLANTYFLSSNQNLQAAAKYIQLFRKHPLVLEEERCEGDLLEALIMLQMNEIEKAEESFRRVPRFDKFETMRTFVNGQITFYKAERYRNQGSAIERDTKPLIIPPQVPLPKDEPQKNEPQKDELQKDVLPAPPAVSALQTDDSALLKRMKQLSRTPLIIQAAAETIKPAEETETVQEPKPPELLSPNAVIVLPPENAAKKDTAEKSAVETEKPVPDLTVSVPQTPQQFYALANEKYREAVDLFEQVSSRDTFIPRWLRTAKLLEGICYERMNEIPKAKQTFLYLAETYPLSSEAAAANFFWAELEHRQEKYDTVLTGCSKCFDILRADKDYACPFLFKRDILLKYYEYIREALQQKKYNYVLNMLHIAGEVMPDIEDIRFRCAVYESWSADLQRQLNQTFGGNTKKLEDELFALYCNAGKERRRYAEFRFGETDYDQQIWQSADYYRLGKDYRRSIALYKQYLRLNWQERQPETLFYLGEMYINIDGLDEAQTELEKSLKEYPNSPVVPRVRLALSKVYFEKKKFGDAEFLLKQNLISDYAPTAAVYRDSIYALGKLLYEEGNTEDAVPYLEDAVKIHPNAVQAADAQYVLSQCYLSRAEKTEKSRNDSPLEDIRRQIDAEVIADLQNALQHIETAERILVQRQRVFDLSESEDLMLRNSVFGSGNLLMKLKRYNEAITVFDLAAARYQTRPEVLDALLQIVLAYRYLNRPFDALPILNRAEVLLNQLKKNGTIPPDNRWEEQIKTQKNVLMTKQLMN